MYLMHHLIQFLSSKNFVWCQHVATNGKNFYIFVIGTDIADSATWCIGVSNFPEKFNNYNQRKDESIICDNDGKNCKQMQCFAVNGNTDLLTGV